MRRMPSHTRLTLAVVVGSAMSLDRKAKRRAERRRDMVRTLAPAWARPTRYWLTAPASPAKGSIALPGAPLGPVTAVGADGDGGPGCRDVAALAVRQRYVVS